MTPTDIQNYETYKKRLAEILAKLPKEEVDEINKRNDLRNSLEPELFSETWIRIDECKGLYDVSNYGRIRRGNEIRKQRRHKGYATICLCSDNIKRTFRVHRLIGKYFVLNDKNQPYINHKNGIRDDNRISNLEWCDNSHNQKESYRVNGRVHPLPLLGKTGALCKNSKPVIQMDLEGNFIKEWPAATEAGRRLGLFQTSISGACVGKNKTAGGFTWLYKSDYTKQIDAE